MLKEILNSEEIEKTLATLILMHPECEEYIKRNVRNYFYRDYMLQDVDLQLGFKDVLPMPFQEHFLDRPDLLNHFLNDDLKVQVEILRKIRSKYPSLKEANLKKFVMNKHQNFFQGANYYRQQHMDFQWNQLSLGDISHCLDTLYIDNNFNKFNFSFRDLYELTCETDEKRRKEVDKAKEKEGVTEVVLNFPDGKTFKKLIDRQAFLREGYLMKHCVGTYYARNVSVYSLRDENNDPKITVEVRDGAIVQSKEKYNAPVSPENEKYIEQLAEVIKSTYQPPPEKEPYNLPLNMNVVAQFFVGTAIALIVGYIFGMRMFHG